MNTNVFLLLFSFVFSFSSKYIKLGIRRNSPKVYLSYLDGFLWRIFPLLRADRLYLIFSSGLKVWLLRVQDIFFPLLLPGVLGFSSVRHEPCPTTNFLIFLFPLTGRRCHFRFRVPANHLASTFFLPVSGDPSEVTEYQHLLVSTLTHILYFDGLLLLIHAWGIVVILFLSSQWDTTWHQQYVNSRTNWISWPWLVNQSRRRKTLNSNQLYSTFKKSVLCHILPVKKEGYIQ